MERAEARRARGGGGGGGEANAGNAWGLEEGELEDPEARGMMVDVMVVSPLHRARCGRGNVDSGVALMSRTSLRRWGRT